VSPDHLPPTSRRPRAGGEGDRVCVVPVPAAGPQREPGRGVAGGREGGADRCHGPLRRWSRTTSRSGDVLRAIFRETGRAVKIGSPVPWRGKKHWSRC
jgi:hypothetical protein